MRSTGDPGPPKSSMRQLWNWTWSQKTRIKCWKKLFLRLTKLFNFSKARTVFFCFFFLPPTFTWVFFCARFLVNRSIALYLGSMPQKNFTFGRHWVIIGMSISPSPAKKDRANVTNARAARTMHRCQANARPRSEAMNRKDAKFACVCFSFRKAQCICLTRANTQNIFDVSSQGHVILKELCEESHDFFLVLRPLAPAEKRLCVGRLQSARRETKGNALKSGLSTWSHATIVDSWECDSQSNSKNHSQTRLPDQTSVMVRLNWPR